MKVKTTKKDAKKAAAARKSWITRRQNKAKGKKPKANGAPGARRQAGPRAASVGAMVRTTLDTIALQVGRHVVNAELKKLAALQARG